MAKFVVKIAYDKAGCIGAAVCEAFDPVRWKVETSGKADLLNGKVTDAEKQLYELEVEVDEASEDFDVMKKAAAGCPATVIHIYKKDTNEQII